MKAIYHVDSENYGLVRNLGFTHVEISKSAWPGSFEKMAAATSRAHDYGLGAIIAPFAYDENGVLQSMEDSFLFLRRMKSEGMVDPTKDYVYAPDEPNLHWIRAVELADINEKITENSGLLTIAMMSWVRPFHQYANTCTFIGLNYYGNPLDLWRMIQLRIEFKKLEHSHRGLFVGAPAIKGKPSHLQWRKMFFSGLDIDRLFWYSFTPDQDKDKNTGKPWLPYSLDKLPEHQDALARINGC